MVKALLGSHGDPRTHALLEEVRALRARVAALEQALEDAERTLADQRDVVSEQHGVVQLEETRQLEEARTVAG